MELPPGSVRAKSPGRPPEGVVLPIMLFLLLALTLLAHGTLLLAGREAQSTQAFLKAIRGTVAARSALEAAVARIPPREVGPPILGVPQELFRESWNHGSWRAASIRWLGPEFFFLEGEGGSVGWSGTRREGAVGWRLDPVARVADQMAWFEVGGEFWNAGAGGTGHAPPLSLPMGWSPADCAPFSTGLETLARGPAKPLISSSPHGSAESGPSAPPGIGFLTGDTLLAWGGEAAGDRVEVGSETLSPGAGCPGTSKPLFISVDGSLEMEAGWSCGLLVVGGDLILKGDGVFQGVLLVGGSLKMEGPWTLQGMGRVGGDVTLGQGGRLDSSACSALLVLQEVPELHNPLLLPGASRIKPF